MASILWACFVLPELALEALYWPASEPSAGADPTTVASAAAVQRACSADASPVARDAVRYGRLTRGGRIVPLSAGDGDDLARTPGACAKGADAVARRQASLQASPVAEASRAAPSIAANPVDLAAPEHPARKRTDAAVDQDPDLAPTAAHDARPPAQSHSAPPIAAGSSNPGALGNPAERDWAAPGDGFDVSPDATRDARPPAQLHGAPSIAAGPPNPGAPGNPAKGARAAAGDDASVLPAAAHDVRLSAQPHGAPSITAGASDPGAPRSGVERAQAMVDDDPDRLPIVAHSARPPGARPPARLRTARPVATDALKLGRPEYPATKKACAAAVDNPSASIPALDAQSPASLSIAPSIAAGLPDSVASDGPAKRPGTAASDGTDSPIPTSDAPLAQTSPAAASLASEPAVSARPRVVHDGAAQRARIVCADALAQAAGVRAGMALAQAQALAPDLIAQRRDHQAEARQLEILAAMAYAFSSQVVLEPPDAVLLEIGASRALFGDWPCIERALRDRLTALGHRHRLCAAPNPAAARVLAGLGDGHAVRTPAHLARALAQTPVAAARLPATHAAGLQQLGMRRLREVLALPRPGLARRFGNDLLLALDRLAGQASDPRPLYRPPDRFERRLEFDDGIANTGALRFPLQRLTRDFAAFLQARDGGVLRFRLVFGHDRHERTGPGANAPTVLEIGLRKPSRDADALLEAARYRIEQLALPAPAHALALVAEDLPAFVPERRDLFDPGTRGGLDFDGLAERLRARLGDAAIRPLAAHPDHRPERAWRIGEAEHAVIDAGQRWPDRPLWLLPSPVPFRGRIVRLLGPPERIETGWWDGQDVRRDYVVAELDGGQRAWLFRRSDHEAARMARRTAPHGRPTLQARSGADRVARDKPRCQPGSASGASACPGTGADDPRLRHAAHPRQRGTDAGERDDGSQGDGWMLHGWFA